MPVIIDEFDGCFSYISLGVSEISNVGLLSSSGRHVVPISGTGDMLWEVWSTSGGNWGVVGCEGIVKGCQDVVTSVVFVPGILVLFWLRPGLGGRRFYVDCKL